MTFSAMGAMQTGKALEKDNLLLFLHLFISNPFCFRACHFLTVMKLGNLVLPTPRVTQFLPEPSFASFPLTEKPGISSRTLGPFCPLRVCWVMDTTGWQCSSQRGVGAELLLQGALFSAPWMANLALPRANEGPVHVTKRPLLRGLLGATELELQVAPLWVQTKVPFHVRCLSELKVSNATAFSIA